MKKTIAAMLLIFAASSAAPAFAAEQADQSATQQKTMMQGKHHKKGMKEKCMGMMMSPAEMKKLPAYAQDFTKSNMKMHKDMMIKYSGNADVDFVRGMIAHHQGAIDMAKVELKYGKDAEMKKLAKNIISAQEKEIKQMNNWLKDHQKMMKKNKTTEKTTK